MFKSLLTNFIIVALLSAFVPTLPIYGDTKVNQDAQRTEQVKTSLAQLGTGRNARVQLKLRDHRKLTGFIASVAADTFTFTDAAANTDVTLRYDEVAQVKGRNAATGKKIAIGVAVGIGVAVLAVVAGSKSWSGWH